VCVSGSGGAGRSPGACCGTWCRRADPCRADPGDVSDPAPERCSAAAPPVDPEDRTPGPAEGGSSALADGSVDSVDSVDSGGSVGSVEPVGSVDVDVVGGELVSVVSVVVGDPGTGAVEDSHGGDDGDSP